MVWLFVIFVVLCFGLVVLVGAPYLPTRKRFVNEALDMLALEQGEIFVDLGSGDGVVLLEAAKRGWICYGYELNPILYFVSWVRTFRYRKQVHITCQNFWNVSLPKETRGVFVFLLDRYMAKLDKKCVRELQPGSKLVSYTFEVPGRRIVKTNNALFLYRY